MSQGDARPSRPPRAVPAPVVVPTEVEDDAGVDPTSFPPCQDPDCGYCENFLAELRQQIKDIDEGREVGMPLEEAWKEMFAPFTPEELAEIEEFRARRASP